MRSPSVLTLTAFVLCSLLTSVPYVQADGTTITEVQHCYTKQGSGSVSPVPTSYAYNTVSLQLPVVVGKTVTKTITPSPTATASSTVTTSVQKTSTVTAGGFPVCTLTSTPVTTKTATSTATTTSTSTLTNTQFSTEITSTRTVFNSAPPSYTPLATQLSQQRVSYGKRGEEGRGEARKRRSASAAHGASLQARSAVLKEKRALKSSSPLFGKNYPQSVSCQGVVKKVSYVTQTVAIPVATATVTAAAPTKTNTVTVVGSTQTKTVCTFGALFTTTKTAPISTATTTTTTTATQMTTTVTTTTQTVQAEATQTAYRQCQPNNVISRADDRYIVGLESDAEVNALNTADANAIDCCIACVNTAKCAFYAFVPFYPAGQQCLVAQPLDLTTCPLPYQLDLSATDSQDGLTVGNGDCSNMNGLNYVS